MDQLLTVKDTDRQRSRPDGADDVPGPLPGDQGKAVSRRQNRRADQDTGKPRGQMDRGSNQHQSRRGARR